MGNFKGLKTLGKVTSDLQFLQQCPNASFSDTLVSAHIARSPPLLRVIVFLLPERTSTAKNKTKQSRSRAQSTFLPHSYSISCSHNWLTAISRWLSTNFTLTGLYEMASSTSDTENFLNFSSWRMEFETSELFQIRNRWRVSKSISRYCEI